MNSIAIGGTILADKIKIIDEYPEKSMLADILSVKSALGGCVPNTLISLAKLDKTLLLKAYGVVGNDADGKYVTETMSKHGIDIKGVVKSKELNTSFTDVYTVKSSGERTFFHSRGANSAFDINHAKNIDCKHFHLGYLMLLNLLDADDCDFGSRSAKLLKLVLDKGITTSIDLVSQVSGDYKQAIYALKYCDYLIINEIEGGGIAQVLARENGKLKYSNIKQILKTLMGLGVRKKVVIHAPEASFCINKSGEITLVNSLELPKGYIKGSVGAGDAFCAGTLYGITSGWDNHKILEFASGAAALNLSKEDSISGMKESSEVFKILQKFPKGKDIC